MVGGGGVGRGVFLSVWLTASTSHTTVTGYRQVCVCVCMCVCASAASYGMARMKEASVVNGEWAAVNAVQVVQARCEQMWCEGEWAKHYMCG